MKRKQYGILMAMVLLCGLTACGNKTTVDSGMVGENDMTIENQEVTVYPEVTVEIEEPESSQDETESLDVTTEAEMPQNNAEDTASQEATATPKETQNSTENTDSARDARMAAYGSALENLNVNHVFPSGNEAGAGLDPDYDMSENKFAVYDIDGDGNEELIIQFTTTAVAGMVEYIYDYDSESQELREQFLEFPALTFYDNGVIKADWSHNQGLAGDFWPYTLYQYEKETDTYTEIGSVDAWDKSYFEQDFSGNPFPDETDVDGDGMVYYFMSADDFSRKEPVDGEKYNQWVDSYLNGAQELNVPFMDLTEENIQSVK